MKTNNLYLITDVENYTPHIGRLVSMMNYVRWSTLDEVEDLNVQHLDYLHDAHSNSIGGLLMHIAAVEASYQESTLGLNSFKGPHSEELRIALDLAKQARTRIKRHGVDHYLRILAAVRSKTLHEFASRDDRWLDEQTPFWDGRPANNYFKWFHVFEDELNHRGQIRWLKLRRKFTFSPITASTCSPSASC
ncbi:MAG: DinB family protein [Acidobacteria bacterium]|nr:DinB family protein [Acidobacteriota bacterium]